MEASNIGKISENLIQVNKMDELSYFGTIFSIVLILVSYYWYYKNEKTSKRIREYKAHASPDLLLNGRNKDT